MTTREPAGMPNHVGDAVATIAALHAALSKLTYYERWIAAFANILFQKQILTLEALAQKMDEVAGRYSAPPPE